MLTQFPCFTVLAANTDCGKTFFSSLLARTLLSQNHPVSYLKIVQTGSPTDSEMLKGNCTPFSFSQCRALFSYQEPISPHRAEKREKQGNTDEIIRQKILGALDDVGRLKAHVALLEGAGGVASPWPSGTPTFLALKPLRTPIILVADSRLGGISATITAYETLFQSGFDIPFILSFEGSQENASFLSEYFKKETRVYIFPNPENSHVDFQSYHEKVKDKCYELCSALLNYHDSQLQSVSAQKEFAIKHFWWPFTQHKNVSEARLVESAFEDCFFIAQESISGSFLTTPLFDASASWWTQGLGHGSFALSRHAAAAASRYGHVLFPGYVHQPVYELTKLLLETVGETWADRVFYTDNGSTAVEVALKMAFRKRFGLRSSDNSPEKIWVVGLKDSYHGDTLATLNATSPNSFKNEEHWYEPHGFWFDFPEVILKDKVFRIEFPLGFDYLDVQPVFSQLDELFSSERYETNIAVFYQAYIAKVLDEISEKLNIGALLIEPVVQGSGGMVFVDPLFQKVLICQCRERHIPIVFDEVFVGFGRIGPVSAIDYLGETPDIACYAKILSGGLLPLAAVLTTSKVFDSFWDDSLQGALLHGHSYTANPVACAVAAEALRQYLASNLYDHKKRRFSHFWSEYFAQELSSLPFVRRVLALGTILAVELQTENRGYFSGKSAALKDAFRARGIEVRVLGNTVYFICSLNTSKEFLKKQESTIAEVFSLYR